MIIVIRLSGMVDLDKKVNGTLDRLRLRKKYLCVIVQENAEKMGMLKRVHQYIAYGKIDNETFRELITKRGRMPGDKPIDAKMITDDFIAKAEKGDFGKMKPFFRLHPPLGGFKDKGRLLYPRGFLGDNKEKISLLLKRML